MKIKKTIKLHALLIAFAMIFALLPLNFAGPARLFAADAPHYNSSLHSFTAPTQSTPAFTSKATNLQNADFNATVDVFSSNNADGWSFSGENSNAVSGILNTNSFGTFITDNFADNNDIPFLSVNPSSSTINSNVLVMANKSTTTTAALNYSQSVGEFYADGFFKVSVDFYAVDDRKPSAVYLLPSTGFSDTTRPIPSIDIKQAVNNEMNQNTSIWQTATFYVKTDLHESLNFTLSLNLGKRDANGNGIAGSGVVYYDNVSVISYSESEFTSIWNTAEVNQYAYLRGELPNGGQPSSDQVKRGRNSCLVDLTKPYNDNTSAEKALLNQYTEKFNSSSTKFKSTGSAQTASTKAKPYILTSDIAANLNLKEVTDVYGNASLDNRGVMLLTSVNSRSGLQYRPNTSNNYSLIIERNEVYMINFYTLSSDSAYFRIYDTRFGTNLPDYVKPYNSGYLSIGQNQTSSSASRNNWILNTIFITGETLNDIKVNFEFWTGGDDNGTGYLLVDDFSIQKVSEQYRDKYSSGQNVNDLKINSLEATADISNSKFNLGASRSLDVRYPLISTDWAVTLEGNTVTNHAAEPRIINGTVNTEETHWNTNNVNVTNNSAFGGKAYGYAINPREIQYKGQSLNNNIYMMQNMLASYQKVTSSTFTLGANSKNIISFDAATFDLSNNQVWASVEVNGSEVTRLRILDPNLGSTPASNILSSMQGWRNYSIAIQTSEFTAPTCTISFILGDASNKTVGCLFVDNVTLQQSSGDTDTSVNLSDPSKLYKKNADDNDDKGGESLFFTPNIAGTASSHFYTENSILSIATNGMAHAVIENKMTETLSSEKWYKYTVTVLKAYVEEPEYYDEDEAPEWGLSLKIKDMDGGYEYLKNEDIDNMITNQKLINGKPLECFEFNFLLKPDSSFNALALVIEFGSENQPVSGSIGIVGTSLTAITNEEYNTFKKDTSMRVITAASSKGDSDGSTSGSLDLDWWIMIPTLIMGLAIIIAVVGTIIRRKGFKRHITQSHTSYARDDKGATKKAPVAKKVAKIKE